MPHDSPTRSTSIVTIALPGVGRKTAEAEFTIQLVEVLLTGLDDVAAAATGSRSDTTRRLA